MRGTCLAIAELELVKEIYAYVGNNESWLWTSMALSWLFYVFIFSLVEVCEWWCLALRLHLR